MPVPPPRPRTGPSGHNPGPSNGTTEPPRSPPDRPRIEESYLDVHLVIGLRDDLVRLTRPDFQRLITEWQIGGGDVVLRGQYERHETQIVLRGSEGGRLSVREANPQNKLPLLSIHTIEEIRAEAIAREEQALRRMAAARRNING